MGDFRLKRAFASIANTNPLFLLVPNFMDEIRTDVSQDIVTENGEDEFQIRLLKDEGVGLLTTKKQENYLILDSLDYWYDLIQEGYPKKKKCSCKNEWFNVRFNYVMIAGTNHVREVDILATCTNCNKTSKPASIEINYLPTDELPLKPIVFCEKPNIRYKYSELTSYWSDDDLKAFLRFVFLDAKLHVYCWYFERMSQKRFFEKVTFEKALQIIENHRYLKFYFSLDEHNASNFVKSNDEKGIYLKHDVWRKEEIIQLSSPTVMANYGLLYCIRYCNQYLEKNIVADKSERFEAVTKQLKGWLKQNFVLKRGSDCFDGEEAYAKLLVAKEANRNTSR